MKMAKMEAFDQLLFFFQNHRQRYTVIPITTVRGPSFDTGIMVSSQFVMFAKMK